ncbi:MAG: DUF11 domain-containing protein, partial [Caldilineaceae bacterium]|nr:DUF11 domain-containing protein [Caldilineaceae bacterium]
MSTGKIGASNSSLLLVRCFAALMLFALLVSPIKSALAADVTVTVDTTVDDNSKDDCQAAEDDCSLRGAISLANGDAANSYTIDIPAGNYILSLTGADEDANATGDLDITRNMALTGAGPQLTVIDADGIDRVFHIMNGARAALSDLTVTGGVRPGSGDAGSGGGFYVPQSHLKLESVHVVTNTANWFGGGITMIDAPNSLEILGDSLLKNNQTTLYGGALYQGSGTTAITDTLIISNTASRGGGIVTTGGIATLTAVDVISNTAVGGPGGGIWNASHLTLHDVKILSNTTTSEGGGLFNSLAAFGITMTGASLIQGNAAVSSNGGGIHIDKGFVRLYGAHIVGNQAIYGGGIKLENGDLFLDAAQVLTNTANVGAGIDVDGATAILTATNGTLIQGNVAVNNGGGMRVYTGTVRLDGVRLLANTANAVNFNGGAIYQQVGTITINKSCIVGNSDTAVQYPDGIGPMYAQQNWWGAANGPSGSAPGNGDSISDDILYLPVLTAPILGCPTIATVQTDLSLTKTVKPAQAETGGAITYTLAYTNNGPDYAAHAVVIDALPISVTNPAFTSSGPDVAQWPGSTYAFTLTDMPVG